MILFFLCSTGATNENARPRMEGGHIQRARYGWLSAGKTAACSRSQFLRPGVALPCVLRPKAKSLSRYDACACRVTPAQKAPRPKDTPINN